MSYRDIKSSYFTFIINEEGGTNILCYNLINVELTFEKLDPQPRMTLSKVSNLSPLPILWIGIHYIYFCSVYNFEFCARFKLQTRIMFFHNATYIFPTLQF